MSFCNMGKSLSDYRRYKEEYSTLHTIFRYHG
jgi:hypothetical protein